MENNAGWKEISASRPSLTSRLTAAAEPKYIPREVSLWTAHEEETQMASLDLRREGFLGSNSIR